MERRNSIPKHTAAAEAITRLILTSFRLHGELIIAGDRLTKDLRLSSARWQVFGQIATEALTASQIARNMGVQRQTVQPLVDALARDGLVEFLPNPNHQRAKLIQMTAAGRRAYIKASTRQVEWANRISKGLDAELLARADDLLREFTRRLQRD